jgi:hypothetical protein
MYVSYLMLGTRWSEVYYRRLIYTSSDGLMAAVILETRYEMMIENIAVASIASITIVR